MPLRRAKRAGSTLLLAACLGVAASVLVPAALGYERYVITSGSMTGAYDRGSIVYARVVPVESLRRGDVITYTPPGERARAGLVTHRIAAIRRDRRGTRVFRTKGDANAAPDPWTFTLPRSGQARAEFGVPHVGYALAALGVREVRMAAIGLPALLIALGALARLWTATSPERRRAAAS